MSDQQFNEQEILEYLLGSLSETDCERFDALSVSDQGFAEQLGASENDLVDAYVHGELTGATLERFETHYLASALRRDKVELAKSFQAYAQRHPVQNRETFVSKQPRRRGSLAEFFFPSSMGKKQPSLLPWSLVAAALVLLTLAGWWTFQSHSTRGNEVVASFVLAPPTRGNNQIPTVTLAGNTTAVRMLLELESDDYAGYRVALTEAAGEKEPWQSATLKPASTDGRKALELLLPTNTLKSQVYSLVVSGIKGDGGVEIISNYSFRAVIK